MWLIFFLFFCLFFFSTNIYSLNQLYEISNHNDLLNDGRDIWYESLSQKELLTYYSHNTHQSYQQKIDELKAIESEILINVYLVGLDQLGKYKLSICNLFSKQYQIFNWYYFGSTQINHR